MKRVVAFTLAALLAACSGGGGSSAPAALPTAAPAPTAASAVATATLKILVPAPPAHSSQRHPKFVASSTAGLLAQVYAHSDAAHAHLLDQLAVDISSGSAACGGTTGTPRTCSVQAPAPPGNDDIVITTFDAPPVAGSFTGAHQLAAALVSAQTIVQGTANSISFVLGGVIGSIGVTIAPTVIHGTMPSAFNVAVTAFDADQNVIVTDAFVDALGNPLPISLVETPNAGTFALTPSTLSAPSTTPVLMAYNGLGTSALSGSVNATAGSATGSAAFTVIGPKAIEYSSGTTTGPYGIALGSDGRVWYGNVYSNQIGAMTTSGVVTDYSTGLSSNAQPYAVALGADNRIWFAENGTGKFGAITTSGTITEYPVSAAGDAEQITEGPDGRIWCAEVNSDNLCAVSTTGTVSTYPVTPSGANPGFVTSGPDGNVWATVSYGTSAYVITMNPTYGTEVHEYPVPASNAFLFGITSGPDGRLWFCDSGNNAIWALTTGGVFTEYAIPTAGAGPWSITAGADGNLWFTEQGGPNIGRITTSGSVTEYPLPSGASASSYYITVGEDANLWLAEGETSKIATFQW
jgi:virginiamycin B lyase